MIIATYIRWRDIRTTSRRILVYISISDLLFAVGYCIGHTWPERGNGHAGCVVQAFVTTCGAIMSYFWTTSLAIYLYITLVKNRQILADKLVSVIHVVCWFTGPIINIIAVAQNALGPASNEVTAGWCWIKHHSDPEKRSDEILWMLFDSKLWEIITMFLIIVLYTKVKLKIRREVSI